MLHRSRRTTSFTKPLRLWRSLCVETQSEQYSAPSCSACTTACPADFDGSGAVNSADFFAFLDAFVRDHISADFNRDSLINSQDFFDYLGAFFTGC